MTDIINEYDKKGFCSKLQVLKLHISYQMFYNQLLYRNVMKQEDCFPKNLEIKSRFDVTTVI